MGGVPETETLLLTVSRPTSHTTTAPSVAVVSVACVTVIGLAFELLFVAPAGTAMSSGVVVSTPVYTRQAMRQSRDEPIHVTFSVVSDPSETLWPT